MKLIRISFFAIFCLSQLIMSQNMQELQKLRDEYKKALERQSLQKPADISEAENTAKSTALPDKLIYSRKDIESLLVNTEKLLQRLKFFEDSTNKMPHIGYDFFTKRDSLPFWQNLPIPQTYILGPGDEVIISMWGESNSRNVKKINRDGQIFVDNIGILELGDKNVEEAKKYINFKFSRVYSTLLGTSPKSFIDLSLGELKSVNVHFVGFVNLPGVHVVHPFSNVISGLIQAGGVDIKGTLRDIKLIRNGEVINSIDFYNYLIRGKLLNDIRLLDQDIVFVSARKSRIPITGRVINPGYYEILSNEKLSDLIVFSGGIERNASKSLFVFNESLGEKGNFIVDLKNASEFTLSKSDSVHLVKYPTVSNYVKIQGQVKNPGPYPFNSKMNIIDILNATMSLDDYDFAKTMDLDRLFVFRVDSLKNTPISITTSLKENINLQNGDHITVPLKDVNRKIESIIITGEIRVPGIYPVNGLTSLRNILELSGGLNQNALEDGVEIFRDSLKIAWDDDSFLLNEGDSLNVLKRSGLVFIDGEVNVPGFLIYRKKDSIKKYVKRAGGYTSFAEKDNIYITYPNGISYPVSSWSSPKVKEGSHIIVGQRKISGEKDLSGWEIFASITSQAGSLATTLLSLSLIMSQVNNNGN